MSAVSKISNALRLSGVDLGKMAATFRGLPRFVREARQYKRMVRTGAQGNFPLTMRNLKPIVLDYYEDAGTAGGHYFFQDLWAARKIHEARPKRHVDIGSRIDGFVAHVLTFMPVEVIDIRPLSSPVEGLRFIQADATDLKGIEDDSIESLSCLNAVEHFGLGRYTDPIDPNACFRAMASMRRVLARGGILYFSVPVGSERVEFNAHRVFSPHTIVKAFDGLELKSFSAVDDSGAMRTNIAPRELEKAWFGCGFFEFRKP